jgi:hypothetical protein
MLIILVLLDGLMRYVLYNVSYTFLISLDKILLDDEEILDNFKEK